MLSFIAHVRMEMLSEATNPNQLTHIHHPEDRPLMHGSDGFEHAHAALMQAHEHMTAKKKSSHLTMKYDGSPSLVFGHHPTTKKFFVATKSAFNKNPKLNYSNSDIDKNHGHAPGLVSKLKHALKHLPKTAPSSGVYQGDVLHTREDHKLHEAVSFTPNTITYTARGDEEKAVKKSHIGIAVHQQYHPHPTKAGIEHMTVSPHPDTHNFKQHSDVHLKTAEHDTSKINYSESDQSAFHKHMEAAKSIHDKHGKEMYAATARHQGETGHLSTYINHTVRTGETPSAKGFQKHIGGHYSKAASKVSTPAAKERHESSGANHIAHISQHTGHYNNLFAMHGHIAAAKNTLVKNLETHEGGLEHRINGAKSKPEGFVVNHKFKGQTHPTKLVNRAEFAKANFAKVRG